MSQLFARSVLVLALLFGLLFAVGTGVLYHLQLPISYAIIFAVTVVGLQYLLGPWIIGLLFDIRWTDPAEISPQFASYLGDLCKKRGIPVPRFGIIEDGNPNAFTYGHLPSDARLVVTRGVIEMLNAEEFNAVVAHEVGHITHYDFVVMTIASIVPLILYILYRGTVRKRGNAIFVAIGAYIAYIISQYTVLFLSRVREYFADEHAAQSVGSANALSTALIKIAYGLARIPQAQEGDEKQGKKMPALNSSQLMGSLGICNFSSASPMAIYSTTNTGQFSTDHMLRAMQWDLWNPWARFFEFQSTHPLIARRVQEASKIAISRNEVPQFPISMQPQQSYWSEFVMDAIFAVLPYLGLVMLAAAMLGLTGSILNTHPAGQDAGRIAGTFANPVIRVAGICLLMSGIGWAFRLLYSYKSEFKPAKVEDLVGEVAVSHIRCIPVEIQGQVIGRGIPGLFWSKDLVMQDDTGFITVIYKQPLSFLETLFGFFRAKDLVGKTGTFRGWYRRGPAPYLELNEAVFIDGDKTKCYYNASLWVGAAVVTIAGLAMMLISI